ncbi:aspartyl protease family protein At5g10770-like [Triticum dicoccoides]|uniref:aspartyl protease family protein At5g10770-like n=1 Tax=Triticum dicoccoides TaxID=85692 RepID=UPI000E7B2FF2|nr:aspartyl protease family protein At5g10770-like [Triticum dicoccoides]
MAAMVSPVLWCALLCCLYSVALGGKEHNFVVVPASSFEPEAACSTSVTSELPNRASVPLAHRHGPCVPSGASGKPSLAERLRRDRARANYIIRKASARTKTLSAGDASVPTFLGDSVDSLEYVVTLGIGTPPVQQTVLIDTGSDLSWVQCAPCNSAQCYPQKDPLFDPSKSSTFAPIPCSTDACKALSADSYDNGCTNATDGGASLCGYAIEYGNHAVTTGVYSTETLTLNAGVSVSNFSFGCGSNQHGPYDKFDGLLGLGGAPESLVSQTSSVYGGTFSYCLPPTSGSAGFLTLGAPRNSTADFLFTPMRHLSPELATFYVVTLTGISVGGTALDIPPAVFSKGMIIDSGTVITGLPKTAYAALRTAFQSAMSQYPLLPPSENGLDTCYNFTGNSSVTVPKVALTFSGGTTVDLSVPSGVLVEGCLAFRGESSDGSSGIIGNVNQRTLELLYDSGRGSVGFRSGAC